MTYVSKDLGSGIRKLPQGTVALIQGKRYRVNELPDRLILTDSDYMTLELDNHLVIKLSDDTFRTVSKITDKPFIFTIARYTLS